MMESLWTPRGRPTIQERFAAWMTTDDGRTVYGEVCDHARRLVARGWTHYSIDALWQIVRFDRDVRVGPEDGYRLNDHFRSRMARRIMDREPDLAGFFEVRELRAP